MEWMKRLSDDDLRALESGNFAAMSDQGLSILEQSMPQGLPTTGTVGADGLTVTPSGIGDTLGEVGRQVGLTARGGIRGAAAIPAMIGDPMMQLINSITGANLPTSSQSLENLMSMVGLPEPRPGLETNVYDITSAMASVGGPAAAARFSTPGAQQFMAPMTERLGMQTLGAGAAAGGAGVAADAGLGEAGQMGAGLAAGMLAPSVAGVTRGIGVGLVNPLRQSGRELAAGNILTRGAQDPFAAISRMESMPTPTPGVQPTMGASSIDYGLAGIERTLSQMPTATGQYAQRTFQNNLARQIMLEKYTGDLVQQNRFLQAVAKRDEVTSGLRDRAFAQSTPVKPSLSIREIDNILQSPDGANSLVNSTLNRYKTQIQSNVGEGGFIDPRTLYTIRKEIADTLDGVYASEQTRDVAKAAKGPLIRLRNAIDQNIESGAPGYRDYMQTYATMSRPIDQIKAMSDVRGRATSTLIDPQTGQGMMMAPRFRKLVSDLEKDPRNPLTKTQMGVMKRIAKELDDGNVMNLQNVRPAGSDTFKNITMGNLLGYIHPRMQGGNPLTQAIETVISPLNWFYRGSEEAIRELLIEAMLDPKLAAQLMKKATAQNITQVSGDLYQLAMQMGYGSALGTGVQQMELE